jgi:hypothetical protein
MMVMTDRVKLTLTAEEGRSIVYDDHDDFELISSEISDTSRWSIFYENIYKRISDGKFFKTNYSVGATECQDERPYEYDGDAHFNEVFPVEKTVIVYE